jgi:hypothetical protein
MRRLLLAAAISALVFGASACSIEAGTGAVPTAAAPQAAPGAGSSSAASGGASAPATPGAAGTASNAGDAALSGDTEAICNQAAKIGGQFGALFAQDLKLLIAAESAQGNDVSAQVQQKATRDLANYSTALAGLSKLAADPTLKLALADMSKQVTALKGDVRKLDDRKLAALGATLDSACGR